MIMSKGKFALGAVFGAIAGAVAGVLMAPKSGKETRAEIVAKSTEVKDIVTKKAEDVAGDAGEIVENVKEKAAKVADDVKTEAVDFKNRTERAVQGAKKGFFSEK